MTNFEFWKDWKRKTKLENSAIKSVESARKIILNEISQEQTISIYLKGSFIRREMNEKSDIDTLTIVKESKYLKKLKKLEDKYGNKYNPPLQFSGYSIWELKYNKRSNFGKKLRASPSRTVKHLEHYKLIYGEILKKTDLKLNSDKKHLQGMLSAFEEIFIPSYNEGKFSFSELIKQVFWLVETEQAWKGNNPPYSWNKLEKSIKDEDHIIHDTLKYRLKPTKDYTERKEFLKKLNQYISALKTELN